MTGSTIRGSRVFISYAREDRDYAERLYEDLRKAGTEPWLDAENLLPGQKWKIEISKAIRVSDFFLALLSSKSISKRGYVQKELREALEVLEQMPESASYLIPVRIDECQPDHPKLLEINWVDLFPVYESGLRRLLLAVKPSSDLAPDSMPEPVRPRVATIAEVDHNDLAQTGWGVIMPHDSDPLIREALAPLLLHRQMYASSVHEDRFREFVGASGYQSSESGVDFLSRHGVGAGHSGPSRMPYYLLIVGSPEEIPFSFQYRLGLQYRVGRIHFDTLEQYQIYARNVVSAETQERSSRTSAFFSALNDRNTKLAIDSLAQPLADYVRLDFPSWKVDKIFGEEATKAKFRSLLGSAPTLLFVTAHGAVFRPGHTRERAEQGGIVCSDWAGTGPVEPNHIFSGADVDDNADLMGTIVFYFGSNSAGTSWQEEIEPISKGREGRPFVSALPKALLGRQRGALAFIGHINDVYISSFQREHGRSGLEPFQAALHGLLSGKRAGLALKRFSELHADLATELLTAESLSTGGRTADPGYLSYLRIAAADYRSYVIIGDPAARPLLNGYGHVEEP